MTQEQITEKLTEILRDLFDDDTLVATPSLSADDVDGWDSLTHVRLILTVERTFHVKFAASEVTGLKNVGDLMFLIKKKVDPS